MPDHRLKRFRQGRDMTGIDIRDDDHMISVPGRVPAGAADDAEHGHPPCLGLIHCAHDVRADSPLRISAADRQDEKGIALAGPADREPIGEYAVPSLVIRPGSQLCDIVDRGVSFNSAQLSEIIDRVRAICGTAANTYKEKAPSLGSEGNKRFDHILDACSINAACNGLNLGKEAVGV